MQFLYSLLLTFASIVLLPYFVYQAIFNRKYLRSLPERLGFLPDSLKGVSRPAIWLHAVSVGETLASHSLARQLRSRFPDHRLILSTTTSTGQAVARSKVAEADEFCYFPLDFRFSVRRALSAIRPEIVILMESELWPNFLSECRSRDIPVIVANGRISDRSFSRSRKFGALVHRLYALVTHFAMQSKLDAERALKLGARANRVSVTGNVKYDIGEAEDATEIAGLSACLDETFALSSTPLIVAGSTHEGEEEMVLAAFERIKSDDRFKDTRLLIAPRHLERFDAVAQLIEQTGLSRTRRSAVKQCGFEEARTSTVILLDSIGELSAVYRFATIVFVGGSLVRIGGHNILEPALYAKPVIVGPYTENFREITQEFLRRKALVQIHDTTHRELIDELYDSLINLLSDPASAEELGRNALKAVEENRGATARTVRVIIEAILQK